MLLADRPAKVGAALIDYKTPLHFGIGFAAGALGISPHVAAILFIAAKVGKLAVQEGFGEALFGKIEKQSYGNEMTDLLAEMVGIGAGLKARELVTGEPAHAVHGGVLGGKIVAVDAPRVTPRPTSAVPAGSPRPGPGVYSLDRPLPMA